MIVKNILKILNNFISKGPANYFFTNKISHFVWFKEKFTFYFSCLALWKKNLKMLAEIKIDIWHKNKLTLQNVDNSFYIKKENWSIYIILPLTPPSNQTKNLNHPSSPLQWTKHSIFTNPPSSSPPNSPFEPNKGLVNLICSFTSKNGSVNLKYCTMNGHFVLDTTQTNFD